MGISEYKQIRLRFSLQCEWNHWLNGQYIRTASVLHMSNEHTHIVLYGVLIVMIGDSSLGSNILLSVGKSTWNHHLDAERDYVSM